MVPIRLIAGLGNPGPQYAFTRHNVGAAFVETLARRFSITLSQDSRSKGLLGRGDMLGHDVRLLIPTTFMNLSGESVGAVARFFKIGSAEILVAYDELAFEPGVAKLKRGGGDNGHNGVKSVIAGLGSERDFLRLRIGVGHPGHKDEVMAYLTGVRMPEAERALVATACDLSDEVLRPLLTGDLQQAMNKLHAPQPSAARDED